jgi:hypothetical protein
MGPFLAAVGAILSAGGEAIGHGYAGAVIHTI